MGSCSMALYLDNSTRVKEYCPIILTNAKTYDIIPLDNGKYLVTNSKDKFFTESCYGEEVSSIRACSFCVISPKCNCQISSSQFVIEPSYKNCVNMSDKTLISHPINLAVAKSFYDHSSLDKIQGNVTFDSATFLPLP